MPKYKEGNFKVSKDGEVIVECMHITTQKRRNEMTKEGYVFEEVQ